MGVSPWWPQQTVRVSPYSPLLDTAVMHQALTSSPWSEAKKGNLEASVVMRADRGSTVLSLIVSMRVFVLVNFIVSAELEGCQGWTFIHCSAKHMIQLPSNCQ